MPSRAERVEALFQAALELEGEERTRFLRVSCAEDAGLLQEVEGLLALDSVSDGRLDSPAPEALALGDARSNLLVGRLLGPFRLTRCLAAGGMGAVYEARQEHPDRRVAVKVLRSDVATPDLERRFRYEASFLGRLQHSGIAHVYGADVAELDGLRVPYIAMELVEGARPITTYAREQRLALAARIELFAQVCDAVHYGHQKGVLHRDLKPGNVLLDRDGRPKLIDFGVARALDPEQATRRTEAGVFLGTVQYVSPEQCADTRDLDVRSDVYSLGVVLYELLCERLPYELAGAPLPQAARIVQECEPRRPSTAARALRGDLETILLKALEKERERRFQSVAELGEDLRRYLRHEPITARAPSWTRRLALFARRHKTLVAALSAIFLATVGASVVSLRFAWSERRARTREEFQSMLANIAAADACLRVHDAPGARQRLERIPSERRGWEWQYLAGRLDLSQAVLTGPLRNCGGPRWRGDRLASGWQWGESGTVVVWNTESREEIARSPALPAGEPSDLDWLDDGSLVWGSRSGTLVRWNPADDSRTPFRGAHAGEITTVRNDGRGGVLSASLDGTVRRWSVADCVEDEILVRGDVAWSNLTLDSRLERIALAGADHTVRVLHLSSPEEEIVLTGHERPVLGVAFHPDGDELASGARDGTILVWDLATRTVVRRLLGHESEVCALHYLGDGERLLSASFDRTLRVWDVASGRALSILHGHDDWISGLTVSPDGSLCATSGFDQTLRIWDPSRDTGGPLLLAHAALVRDLAFSLDGRLLATASFDGTAKLFETSNWTETATLGEHGARVMSVAFHPTGRLVATASNDHRVRLWDAVSAELLHTLEGHTDGVHCVAFSPRGDFLASGSKDGTVRVLAWPGLRDLASLQHGAWVNGVVFAPDGESLVTAGRDGTLRCWNFQEAREVWRRATSSGVHDIALSPDGNWLAAALLDGTLRIWGADTGEEGAALAGHTQSAHGVAFTPDGLRLASTGADRTVRLWDPSARAEVLVLRGHESWVFGVDFSPDGTLLATGGGNYDGTGVGIRIWKAR